MLKNRGAFVPPSQKKISLCGIEIRILLRSLAHECLLLQCNVQIPLGGPDQTLSETREVWSGLVWFGPCPSSGIWP